MADPKSFVLSAALHDYLVDHGTPPDAVQRDLIAETTELGAISAMQVAPEQGTFLTLLVRVMDARQVVEVGTFTGYSALCLARGLGEGGRLTCCDISEEWTAVARRAWARDGVDDRIDLRLGPALDTLRALPGEPYLDLAFVDADKGGYIDYFEELVPRLRPNGMLLVDNVLWGGAVIDPSAVDENTEAIRSFNDHAASDERVEGVMLPVADGLSLFRKLP
jgi:caffeoyl-CoA O-methyltransferase